MNILIQLSIISSYMLISALSLKLKLDTSQFQSITKNNITFIFYGSNRQTVYFSGQVYNNENDYILDLTGSFKWDVGNSIVDCPFPNLFGPFRTETIIKYDKSIVFNSDLNTLSIEYIEVGDNNKEVSKTMDIIIDKLNGYRVMLNKNIINNQKEYVFSIKKYERRQETVSNITLSESISNSSIYDFVIPMTNTTTNESLSLFGSIFLNSEIDYLNYVSYISSFSFSSSVPSKGTFFFNGKIEILINRLEVNEDTYFRIVFNDGFIINGYFDMLFNIDIKEVGSGNWEYSIDI